MTTFSKVEHRKFDTIAVCGSYDHAEAVGNNGSICEPTYLSSAQHFETAEAMRATLAGESNGWVYTRLGNPTITYLENVLASLEGYQSNLKVSSTVTSSGMAAIFLATLPFLAGRSEVRPNVVVSSACYGGSFMIFNERIAVERGVDVRWVVDPMSLAEWHSAMDENTRFLFVEVPSNPTLSLADIPALSELAHDAGVPLLVDATLATPALLRPLALGADIVVHSIGKSMGVNGSSLGGVVSARHNILSRVGSDLLKENFALYVKQGPLRDIGCILSPFNASMILNDLRGLRARMDQMSISAMKIATFLNDHHAIAEVYYPGLPSHRAHDLATRDMKLVDSEAGGGIAQNRFGYLIGVRPEGGIASAYRIFDKFELIWRANDLGRVKSVATIPAIATHKQIGDLKPTLSSIPPEMIRLSVGLEHTDDIIDDLAQALAVA